MPSEENESIFEWITAFKTILGGVILVWMLYHYFYVEKIDLWLFGIPGLLLGYDPKSLLSAMGKK